MTPSLMRLARVFRRIAHDAGYAMIADVPPDTLGFCRQRYERTRLCLADRDPDLAAALPPLPENATAGLIRMAARMAALTIHEALRERRRAAQAPRPACLAWLFETT